MLPGRSKGRTACHCQSETSPAGRGSGGSLCQVTCQGRSPELQLRSHFGSQKAFALFLPTPHLNWGLVLNPFTQGAKPTTTTEHFLVAGESGSQVIYTWPVVYSWGINTCFWIIRYKIPVTDLRTAEHSFAELSFLKFSFIFYLAIFSIPLWGFPGGSVVKICLQCKSPRRCRFYPWVRKIPWRRAWQPTPVFLPGESHRQRILAGRSRWSHRVGHD